MSDMKLRPSVQAFAERMEATLRKHDASVHCGHVAWSQSHARKHLAQIEGEKK